MRRKPLHVERKFQFGLQCAIVNFEHSVNEFLQVYIPTTIQIDHTLEPFSDYSRKLSVLEKLFEGFAYI